MTKESKIKDISHIKKIEITEHEVYALLDDELKTLYYLLEQKYYFNNYASNTMITYHLKWSKSTTTKIRKRLEGKKLIDIVNKCPYCGERYVRMPVACTVAECSKTLINHEELDDDKKKAPYFIMKINHKGEIYLVEKVNELIDKLNEQIDTLKQFKQRSKDLMKNSI